MYCAITDYQYYFRYNFAGRRRHSEVLLFRKNVSPCHGAGWFQTMPMIQTESRHLVLFRCSMRSRGHICDVHARASNLDRGDILRRHVWVCIRVCRVCACVWGRSTICVISEHYCVVNFESSAKYVSVCFVLIDYLFWWYIVSDTHLYNSVSDVKVGAILPGYLVDDENRKRRKKTSHFQWRTRAQNASYAYQFMLFRNL